MDQRIRDAKRARYARIVRNAWTRDLSAPDVHKPQPSLPTDPYCAYCNARHPLPPTVTV